MSMTRHARAGIAGIVVVFALSLLCAGDASAQARLRTTRGTRQLGGTATFTVDTYIPEGLPSRSGYQLGFSPSFGYFVIDNLSISGTVSFTSAFGDLYRNVGEQLFFGVGVAYIVPTPSVRPYFGVNMGFDFEFDDNTDDVDTFFQIGFPLGILIPLGNPNVALDLGLRINILTGIGDIAGTRISVPIGYLGVQAFF